MSSCLPKAQALTVWTASSTFWEPAKSRKRSPDRGGAPETYQYSPFRFLPEVATACFDPTTNAWSEMAPLKTMRYNMPSHFRVQMTTLDGKLYVVGGSDDETQSDKASSLVDCFDPTAGDAGVWTRLPYMGTGRSHAGVAALDGMLYAVGGCSDTNIEVPLSSVECYNLSTDRWSYSAALGSDADGESWELRSGKNRIGVRVVALGGKIYAMGGRSYESDDDCKCAYCFDPSTGKWSEQPTLPFEFCDGTGVAVMGM